MSLISLEYAEAMLGPAELSEAQLAGLPQAMAAASAAIERFCGRAFAPTEVSEVLRPGHDGVAMLRHFPVLGVRRIAYGRVPVLAITHDTAYRASATWVYPEGADSTDDAIRPSGIVLRNTSLEGIESVAEISFAEAPTVSGLLAAINGAEGWSAAVASQFTWAPYPTLELFGLELEREVLVDWTASPPTRHAIEVDGFAWPLGVGQYDLDRRAGILTLGAGWPYGGTLGDLAEFPTDFPPGGSDRVKPGGEILCRYRGGFATVPPDVQAICAEAAKTLIQGLASDATVSEERGLNYGYKVRDAAEAAVGGLSRSALEALSTYRVHRA